MKVASKKILARRNVEERNDGNHLKYEANEENENEISISENENKYLKYNGCLKAAEKISIFRSNENKANLRL